MTKEEKKKMLIAGGLVVAAIILIWLLKKTNKYNPVTNGAGNPAGTSYLTYNIPPINSQGLTVPNFGDFVINSGSPSGNGGCGSCDMVSYYGSNSQLAAGLAPQSSQYDQALQEALSNFSITNSYTIDPGTVYGGSNTFAPPVTGNV